MNDEELLAEYSRRHARILVPLATSLTSLLEQRVDSIKRIDRVSARAKNPARFLIKATKEKKVSANTPILSVKYRTKSPPEL
ncbi:hypothetical protein ACKZDW_17780 [Ralstonia syzygii subsp. celebesensis]